KKCFLNECPSAAKDFFRECGLVNEQSATSVALNGQYWLHYLTPLAAYGKKSRIWEVAKRVINTDPGINVGLIEDNLPPELIYPFWYSTGGDVLQNKVVGWVEPKELVADELGMNALSHWLADPTQPLSTLTRMAKADEHLLVGDGYLNQPYYQLANQAINPAWGHKIMRGLAQVAPFLCRNGLVPIENTGLIDLDSRQSYS
ncbi:hypothetical protein MUP65_02305, partial [Patescibacteria group bacterium]|nr:hypothetical protein [Patescibacteria group bacterium]